MSASTLPLLPFTSFLKNRSILSLSFLPTISKIPLSSATLIEDVKSRIISSPSPYETALAALLLLDQVPRNSFRGAEAIKVYRDFDPIAEKLSKWACSQASGKLYEGKDRSCRLNPLITLWCVFCQTIGI
jgi:hypothetical protein